MHHIMHKHMSAYGIGHLSASFSNFCWCGAARHDYGLCRFRRFRLHPHLIVFKPPIDPRSRQKSRFCALALPHTWPERMLGSLVRPRRSLAHRISSENRKPVSPCYVFFLFVRSSLLGTRRRNVAAATNPW